MIYLFTKTETVYRCECSGYETDIDHIFIKALEHPSSKINIKELQIEYNTKYSFDALSSKAQKDKKNKTKDGWLKQTVINKLRREAGTFTDWLIKEKGFTEIKLKEIELGHYYEN